jgi:hypothetical protein
MAITYYATFWLFETWKSRQETAHWSIRTDI